MSFKERADPGGAADAAGGGGADGAVPRIRQSQSITGQEARHASTPGRHEVLNADEARRRAALIIARTNAGEELVSEPLSAKPANGPAVGDLAARYLEEHAAVRCQPKTAKTTRSVVNRHIVPALAHQGGIPLAGPRS